MGQADETACVPDCSEHEEQGCATEWAGFTDEQSELLVRTLYRPGQPPVVQVALKDAEGKELIADFCPYDREVRFAPIQLLHLVEEFGESLAGEFASAAHEAKAYWDKQGA